RPVEAESADGETPVSVFNTLAPGRGGMARHTLTFPRPGTGVVTLAGPDGQPVPYLAEGIRRRPHGSLAELTVPFRATDVPAVGYRAFVATGHAAGEGAGAAASGWGGAGGVERRKSTLPVHPRL